MQLRLLSLFLLILVCSISAASQTVVESESKIVFASNSADLLLVVDARGVNREVRIGLELLDPDGNVKASVASVIHLKSGKRAYRLSIPIGDLLKTAGEDIAWYRLRYRLADVAGFISLSELIKDDFELRAAAFERVVPGQNLQVRIRTIHPLTKRSVKRVLVGGALEFDLAASSAKDKLTIKASGETNGDGLLTLEFKIPADAKIDGDGNLKITGNKDGVIRTIDESLDSQDVYASVFLSADKPLYQPGQSFNVRGLLFDPNNFAVSACDLEFSIEDEDDTVLFRQTVKTSTFGIASISWTIPENAKLGHIMFASRPTVNSGAKASVLRCRDTTFPILR